VINIEVKQPKTVALQQLGEEYLFVSDGQLWVKGQRDFNRRFFSCWTVSGGEMKNFGYEAQIQPIKNLTVEVE
jgi:hypothetical protein